MDDPKAPYVLTATCSGSSLEDIEIALEEVLRHAKEGYLSGFGSNDAGAFSFSISQHHTTP